MNKDKSFKVEAVLNSNGAAQIEIAYKLGNNWIRKEATMEVISAFKDYIFLLHQEDTDAITLEFKREIKNESPN